MSEGSISRTVACFLNCWPCKASSDRYIQCFTFDALSRTNNNHPFIFARLYSTLTDNDLIKSLYDLYTCNQSHVSDYHSSCCQRWCYVLVLLFQHHHQVSTTEQPILTYAYNHALYETLPLSLSTTSLRYSLFIY